MQNTYNHQFISHLLSTVSPDMKTDQKREVKNKVNIIPNYSMRFFHGKYYLEFELPGVDPKKIRVLVRDNEIHINIKKFYINTIPSPPPPPSITLPNEDTSEEEDSDDNADVKVASTNIIENLDMTYHRYIEGACVREQNYITGAYMYKLKLPYHVEKGTISSTYKWGILSIIITPNPSTRFKVEIENND